MNRKNFEGRNIDEAIALACSFFAVERKELDIEIIREPSAGIFGLGTKKAVIQARKQRKNLPEQQEKILAGAPVQEQAADMEEIQINGEDEDFDEDEMDSSDEEIQNPEELKALLKETTAELLKPISTQYDLTIDLETRPITFGPVARELRDRLYEDRILGTGSFILYFSGRSFTKSFI